jgi:hypothetical protein
VFFLVKVTTRRLAVFADHHPCRIAYIRKVRAAAANVAPTAVTEAKITAQKLRAEQIQLQLARERGELIEMRQVELVFTDIIDTLYAELGGVPAASTRDLPLRNIIEGYIEGAFGRACGDPVRGSNGHCELNRTRSHPINWMDRRARLILLASGIAAERRAGYPGRDSGRFDRSDAAALRPSLGHQVGADNTESDENQLDDDDRPRKKKQYVASHDDEDDLTDPGR